MKVIAIFVALWAFVLAGACSSSSKAKKTDTLPTQVKKADPGPAANELADKADSSDELDAEPAPEPLTLESAVYFAFDSALLSDSARAKLNENAQWLQQNPGKELLIEGHTDEAGTDEYNIALGQQRAQAAYDYLIRLGVDADRLATMSYGEERPADPARDDLNRRSQLVPQDDVN